VIPADFIAEWRAQTRWPTDEHAREAHAVPQWFHLGFHGATAGDVRALFLRMQKDGVDIAEPWTEFESGTVQFHWFDPSGYRIEVRWDAPG
jgi:catechol 2,3-dioxygenase-like lactoylglutathione lyase family enzyme